MMTRAQLTARALEIAEGRAGLIVYVVGAALKPEPKLMPGEYAAGIGGCDRFGVGVAGSATSAEAEETIGHESPWLDELRVARSGIEPAKP